MKNVLTSLIELELYSKNILDDLVIVQFTTSENYIPYGALFLDQFIYDLKASSVLFEKGKSLYTLFNKNEFKKIDLVKELENLKGGENLMFLVIDSITSFQKIPEYLIAQLLINTMSSPKNELLKFNNLTGGLYVFNNSMLEITKTKTEERLVRKIKAMEFRINKDLSLNFGVRTFSSLLLRKSIDITNEKLNKEAKYTFSYATKSMRRILPSEESNFRATDIFVKRSSGKNSIVPFLDFDDLESFNESKVGIIFEILNSVKNKLPKYLSIGFKENNISETHRTKRNSGVSVLKSLNNNNNVLNIVDLTDEEDFSVQIDQLICTIENVVPDLKIKRTNSLDSSSFNIRCIHNKDYYDKYKLDDAYDRSIANVQHLTYEDFDFKSEPSIKAILKEIVIKNDIQNKKLSLVDWKAYEFTNDWIFGIKDENHNYFFVTVKPNGKLIFAREENPRLSPLELQRLMTIYDSYSNIEGIILDPDGNVNVILRTNLFTIPDIEFIQSQLKSASENIKLDKATVIACLKELTNNSEAYDEYVKIFEDWNEPLISKKDVLSIVSHRAHKKKLNELIFKKTGILMKTYFRDKNRFEIMDSNLDIHTFQDDGQLHYYVGTIGQGIKTSIPKASVVRKIINIDDGSIFFDQLLPLMNVDFVRYGDLTVIPFPFKYLREWINLQTTTR